MANWPGLLPSWEREGYGGPPETFIGNGSELILRAYSRSVASLEFEHGTSRKVGNCFFVPACGRRKGPITGFSIEGKRWTGAFLEKRLNAFFWGNAFDRIGVWGLSPKISYDIGPIGQNTRYNLESKGGIGRYLEWPGGDQNYFRQVTLLLPSGITRESRDRYVKSIIRPVDDVAVVQPLSSHYGHA